MSSYLIAIKGAVSVFFVLGLLLLIPLCVFHYHRFGYFRPSLAITFYLFLLYCLCAVFLVILPLPKLTADYCQVNSLLNPVKLAPLQFLTEIINGQNIFQKDFDLISSLKNPLFLQVFFNFLLLMPLGFFARYYLRASFKKTLIITIVTTFTFELTQLTAIFGLYPCAYRTFDLEDIILNTLGAIVGYLIVPLFFFLPNIHR